MTLTQTENVTDQFAFLARELSNRFPELNLSFNLLHDSGVVRIIAETSPPYVFELQLEPGITQALLYDTIFTLKKALRAFDA